MIIPALLLAATFAVRNIATIPPRIGEGSSGRLLALDTRDGVTTAIYTHIPPLAGAQAELAATRIAADGTSSTTSIAPFVPLGGINAGAGAATSRGYLVAWYDGALETAFIDSSLQLTRPIATLSTTGSYPNAACNERRCLVTWLEPDSRLTGALFDDSGKLLVQHIDFGKVAFPAKPAASSSQFMLAVSTGTGDDRELRLLPLDNDGVLGDPVTLPNPNSTNALTAIDSIGDGFAIVTVAQKETAGGGIDDTFFAENVDRSGTVVQPWRPIAHAPILVPYPLLLGGHGAGRLLLIGSAEHTVLVTGAIPDQFLYAIRLGPDLQAIDETPITVSNDENVNDSPLIAGESPHYVVGWSHGVGFGHVSYRDTTPRLAVIDNSPPANLRGGFPLITGPATPVVLGSVPSGDGYDVLFGDSPSRSGAITSLFVTHVSRNGTIGNAITVAEEGVHIAKLATNGDELLVAWLSEKGLSTRSIGPDGVPGTRYDSSADVLLSDLVWDGAEFAAIVRERFEYSIRTFDPHGKPIHATKFCSNGDAREIAASHLRIAIAPTCGTTTSFKVFDGPTGALLHQTPLAGSPYLQQIVARDDRFMLFARNSVMEFDRDGNPLGTPLETDEQFYDPVIPFGNGFAVLGRTLTETSVRYLDLEQRTFGDAVTFPGRFDRAWPGAGATVLLIQSNYPDRTTSFREITPAGALTRRRAF